MSRDILIETIRKSIKELNLIRITAEALVETCEHSLERIEQVLSNDVGQVPKKPDQNEYDMYVKGGKP